MRILLAIECGSCSAKLCMRLSMRFLFGSECGSCSAKLCLRLSMRFLFASECGSCSAKLCLRLSTRFLFASECGSCSAKLCLRLSKHIRDAFEMLALLALQRGSRRCPLLACCDPPEKEIVVLMRESQLLRQSYVVLMERCDGRGALLFHVPTKRVEFACVLLHKRVQH